MCGIAGILEGGGEAPDPAQLARMLDAQVHRGPDGRGSLVDGPLALGAVRLAVREKGPVSAQPMGTGNGRFSLAYNGEVYNHAALKRELEGLGERFRSAGDTEVVLKALARWGTDGLKRLEGVFALAFWDARERALLLARDRVGVRPLYWAESGGALLFASEIKGLLASGRVRPGIDGASMAELFRFQNVWSPRTLFAGIRPVPAGGWILARPGRLEMREGAPMCFPGDLKISEEEAVAGLRERLSAAVARQLESQVPVGAALSGGLDGAAIVSEAARLQPDLKTFTVGFEMPASRAGERATDERPAAAAMARFLGTRHAEISVTPEKALEDLPALIRHLEEPRLAASFQNLEAARLAASSVTVLLSGGGGDELFGGYPWRYRPVLETRGEDDFAKAFLGIWDRVRPGPDFWTEEGNRLVSEGDPEGVLRRMAREAEAEHPQDRAMAVEARTFLPAYCLLEDKLHMAFGAEVRVPLLDPLLLDWAPRLPKALRMPEEGTGKRLLRKALAGRLPGPVLDAPKQGFVPPLLGWAASQPWAGYLRKTLTGRGLIRPGAIRKDVEALVSGIPEPLQRVWTTLLFELWCREFLDGKGS